MLIRNVDTSIKFDEVFSNHWKEEEEMKSQKANKKGPASRLSIVQAVQSGIRRAALEYPKMSGNLVAGKAPEYFFVSYIVTCPL